jgi:2-polyprenyl-6-methoxyphenol hydroxylase-like FAD-dependent oxidoreductase
MIGPDIFHRDFTPTPFWWEAYRPSSGELVEVPREARVAIVGGGYAGLSAALELARHGIDAVVLEANELGFGASTRNGARSAAASTLVRASAAGPPTSKQVAPHGCCPTRQTLSG